MPDAKHDRRILIGLPAIAAYMGFQPQTIRNWAKRHAFPAGKLPDGRWAVSTDMIDEWLRVRNPHRRLA